MKRLLLGAVALSLLVSPAFAQQRGDNRRPGYDQQQRWQRGARIPSEYRSDQYVYFGWRGAGLRPPQRGYRWLQIGDQYVLADMRSGRIIDVVVLARRDFGRDRNEQWRARYSRAYTLNDDRAYTECRNEPDPAGALAGAFIGGLLGNAAGGRGDRGGATVAGVIAGGAIGAALTSNLKCEDRSYAYDAYSRGFNGGRANARYEWRNPRNGDRGELHILDYYDDEDDFRCAVYSHTIYIDGRPQEARGRACQQPNGSWAIID